MKIYCLTGRGVVDQRDGVRDTGNLWRKFSLLGKAGDLSPTPEAEIIGYL